MPSVSEETPSWVEHSDSGNREESVTVEGSSDNENANNDSTTSSSSNNDEANNPFANDDPSAMNNDDDNELQPRLGTISSARFNILATMVGGGSLSLPLAFQESGNVLVGPIVLILVGLITDFCFRLLVASGEKQPTTNRRGNNSIPSITRVAFGPSATILSAALVCAMCFVGTIGYCVLLRDMLEPIADLTFSHFDFSDGQFRYNCMMLLVVFIVTPVCTLKTLTSLERFGALSMISVLVLGSCVLLRSFECNFSERYKDERIMEWYQFLTFVPKSFKQLLNAIPLYISCFVCHYNIPTVHNELQNPTKKRTSYWLRSTTWSATTLYLLLGIGGSMYGNCTTTGHVQGNVLLDFQENDPLLMVGRMCLALTITLAFPMLIIPARDIVWKSCIQQMKLWWISRREGQGENDESIEEEEQQQRPVSARLPANWAAAAASSSNSVVGGGRITNENTDLEEPLLSGQEDGQDDEVEEASPSSSSDQGTFLQRLLVSMFIFWSAASIACCVDSIDVVWDLLGSSLSILLSYLIPCGSYLVISKQREYDLSFDFPPEDTLWKRQTSRKLCWIIFGITFPLMFISTGNAIASTFFGY